MSVFCEFKIGDWIFCYFKRFGLRKLEENMIGQKLYSVFLNLIKSNLGKYEMTPCSLLIFFSDHAFFHMLNVNFQLQQVTLTLYSVLL